MKTEVWKPTASSALLSNHRNGVIFCSIANGFSGSRIQIERDLAARHVEGHGAVLVDDAPLAVDAAKALRGAPPHVDRLARDRLARHMVQAMAERRVVARHDLQVADLIGHRTVIAVEPLLNAPAQI